MDISIFLGIISVVLGIVQFFIKIESKPLRISARVFFGVAIIGCAALYLLRMNDIPQDLHEVYTSDSSSGEDMDIVRRWTGMTGFIICKDN